MFGWIAVLVGGFLAGLIARKLVPGEEPGGAFLTTIIGVVGGIVGKLVLSFVGMRATSWDPLWNLLVAVLGAVILLYGYHALCRSQRSSPV